MSTAELEPPATESEIETLADLIERLGSIPLDRIRFHPAPGTATEKDVLARPNGVKRICELVEGVLVEKPMGYYESRLAAVLIHFIEQFLESSDLGIVLGADGTLRLAPGLVRIPDVAFISWRHFPKRRLPREPIPDLAPDLAVELLSASNTKREMDRKLREYFSAGVQRVWMIDPETQTCRVHRSPRDSTVLTIADSLDGGDELPGFVLPLKKLFERAGSKES